MAAKRETLTVAAGQVAAQLMNEASNTLAAIERVIQQASLKRVDLLVLPECAYPAYLIGSVVSYRAGEHLSSEEFVGWLRERAARYRLHIVSGMIEDTGAALHNTAVFIDEKGREIGRTRKRFLWHADHDWFAPGDEIRAFDSPIGRIGIIICAEARDPELIATLIADGAELIAMPTCWINGSREPGCFENPQPEFLMEARAREFGVPFVCADKSGLELGAVGYVGQSMIVRADGSIAAKAPSTGEAVIAARVVRQRPPRVWISQRRRERLLNGPPPVRPPPDRGKVTVAVMPTAVANQRFTGGMGEPLFEPLAQRGVRLLLVNMSHEAPAEQLAMLANAYDIRAVGFPMRADAFELGPARIGCVAGQWARSFAASRALVLDGAEMLMFFDYAEEPAILRARAIENRVFVLAAGDRSAIIIDPDGQIVARSDPDHPAEVIAEIDLTRAADKLIAPGTDIFNERHPQLYRY